MQMLPYFIRNKFLYFTLLIAVAMLFVFYSAVIISPNDFLFDAGGDGIKNYYTYLFHAKYDSSFTEFTGMNYPYYEHIVYTDAHPLFSWIIGQFGLADYGIGILNLMMLFSYPIGALFLFKIFKHYKVADWWAVGGAIAIIFLSPQVFRLTGHYSMSYVFAVPIMWYLLIKCYSTNKLIWSWAICIYMILFFFTHPYLGMILAFFGIVFWILQAIIDRKNLVPSLIKIGIQIILPIVFFQGSIFLTDTHLNRLSNPAGFFNYYASWKSITIPHDGPLDFIASDLKINIGNWESWSYIGFPTLIFTVIIGIFLIKSRRAIDFKALLKKELLVFLIAAYLILLFAFCFPLKYDWMRWLTDLLGPIKQFRILGRFTWIFYYVFTVATLVGIYKLSLKQAYLKYLFIGSLVFYFLEFKPAHERVSEHISQDKNSFKKENLSPEMESLIDFVQAGNYDAIIFLPFQHMSSENIMLLGAEEANRDAFILSYHTGIPLMNSISSRMSLTESIDYNNYFSPGFMEKELTYALPDSAKILLIKNRNVLKVSELRMIWESEMIFENETYTAFDFDQYAWNSSDRFENILKKNKNATAELRDNWRSDTTDVWFVYESFHTLNSELTAAEIFGGQGALKAEKTGWNKVFTLNSNQIKPGDYTIRFWYNINVDRPDVTAVMEEVHSDTTLWLSSFAVNQSTVIVNKWCLVEMEFSVNKGMQEVNVLLTGNGSHEFFIIDELLIQKANANDLFRREVVGEIPYVIYNNYWLDENSFKRN